MSQFLNMIFLNIEEKSSHFILQHYHIGSNISQKLLHVPVKYNIR